MNDVRPGQRARNQRARVALRALGVIALCAAAADALWFTDAEKSAHYLFGYWFDALWAVQVPLLFLGVAALASSFLFQARQTRGQA
jgi:hypothetical protein